jgi:hypothetical protein
MESVSPQDIAGTAVRRFLFAWFFFKRMLGLEISVRENY